jgi:Bacterial Peptidase A24 N-terminal domain
MSAKAYVDIPALELMDVELPGIVGGGKSGRNGQRRPGSTRRSPRRSRTAKAPHYRNSYIAYHGRKTLSREAIEMLLGMFTFGMFGLIVGSFFNVVIIRGTGALIGRSACMSCGKTLAWYDMVPVVSWFLLRGRCRTCGSALSIQYPLVEGATAILFALVGLWVAWPG